MSKEIKMLIMDVDGTLTDGGIYMGENGELMKRFHARDGYGIHSILRENEIRPVVITGRSSTIVKNRCKELGIVDFIQQSEDKLKDASSLIKQYSLQWDEVACIGDDIPDLEIIKMAGLSGCPKDAAECVKNEVDYVSESKGGEGAVRDFIDWIVGRMNSDDISIHEKGNKG